MKDSGRILRKGESNVTFQLIKMYEHARTHYCIGECRLVAVLLRECCVALLERA